MPCMHTWSALSWQSQYISLENAILCWEGLYSVWADWNCLRTSKWNITTSCSPSYFQKLMYSGYKCSHGIKFQSIVTPACHFASMYGPVSVKTSTIHFSFQLVVSLTNFMLLCQIFPGRDVIAMYGDPAYPQSIFIFGGYKNPLNGSAHALWNTSMSKVCKVVKWALASILSQWSFLDFRAGMKIFQSPVAKLCIAGAFLVNLQTCFYGSQTMGYFD